MIAIARQFITLFSGVVAGGPMVARAQQQKLTVIGFLNSGSPVEWDHLVLAFNHGLNEAGYETLTSDVVIRVSCPLRFLIPVR